MVRLSAWLLLATALPLQDPGKEETRLPPFPVVVATERDAAAGTLIGADDSSVVLRTDTGDVTLPWSDLRPFSVWRLRSLLAGTDAAKRLELAEYCREKRLWREARWEAAAARSLGSTGAIPDLENLRKQDAEEFLPGALALGSDEIVKRLDRDRAADGATRTQERTRQIEELKGDFGVTEIVTLAWKGDVSRRLDIVFVSDGFAAAEQARYTGIVDQLVRAILKVEPMANYPSYINFHRINIAAPRSGIGGGQTAIGSRVDNGILTCNRSKAWEMARLAPDAELVCVIANVKDVRATGGGGVLTLDASGDINDTAIHELGHAFAGLDDEYVDPSVAGSHQDWGPEDEAAHFNTTREKDPRRAKWHYWIHPPSTKGIQVGCFEGAYYRETGYFRPSPACRMNSSSDPLCVVCFEQMEKSFYTLVSPIDEASPRRTRVRAFLDDELTFSANAVMTEGKGAALGSLSAAWYVDGVRSDRVTSRDRTTLLRLKGADLKAGRHEIALRVEFQNRRIRRDHGLLSGHRVWTVEVLPFSRPRLAVTGDLARGPMTAKMEGSLAAAAGVRALPAGAGPGVYQDASGTVSHKPDEALAGAFRFRFAYVDKQGTPLGFDERTVAVPHKDGRNLKPFLKLPSEIVAVEGKPLYFRVQAWDPDGDQLVYTASGLPEDALFDSFTGELFWNVGYSQGGLIDGIKFSVTDGAQTFTTTGRIVVRDRPIEGAASLQGFDLVLGLRSGNPGIRNGAIARLAEFGTTFRLLEHLRLLRDRDPRLAEEALAALETLLGGAEGKSDPSLHALFVQDIEMHLWHFTDAPKVLAFVEARAGTAEQRHKDAAIRTRCTRIRKTLKEITAYNRSRGL